MEWYWYVLIVYAVLVTIAFLILKFLSAPDPIELAKDIAYEQKCADNFAKIFDEPMIQTPKETMKGGENIEYPASDVIKLSERKDAYISVNVLEGLSAREIVEYIEKIFSYRILTNLKDKKSIYKKAKMIFKGEVPTNTVKIMNDNSVNVERICTDVEPIKIDELIKHNEPQYVIDTIETSKKEFIQAIDEHLEQQESKAEITFKTPAGDCIQNNADVKINYVSTPEPNYKFCQRRWNSDASVEIDRTCENMIKAINEFVKFEETFKPVKKSIIKAAEENYFDCKLEKRFPAVLDKIKIFRDEKVNAIRKQEYESAARARALEKDYLCLLYKLCGEDIGDYISEERLNELMSEFTEDELQKKNAIKANTPINLKESIIAFIDSKSQAYLCKSISLEQFNQMIEVLDKYGIKSVQSQLEKLSETEQAEVFSKLNTL